MFLKIVLTILTAGVFCGAAALAAPNSNREDKKRPVMIADQMPQKGKLTHRQDTALIKLQQNLRKERNAMLKSNGGKQLTLEQRHQLRDEENRTKQQIMMGKNLTGNIENVKADGRRRPASSAMTEEQQRWLTQEMIRTNRDLYSRKSGDGSSGVAEDASNTAPGSKKQ